MINFLLELDKCSEGSPIYCKSPDKEDCMPTCQNPKLELEKWKKCDPKTGSKCYSHCPCPTNQLWDANIDKCVKKCRRKLIKFFSIKYK